MQGTNTKNVF